MKLWITEIVQEWAPKRQEGALKHLLISQCDSTELSGSWREGCKGVDFGTGPNTGDMLCSLNLNNKHVLCIHWVF